MFQKIYYVDKQTGTFADVCAAYGLAVILDSVLERVLGTQAKRTVRIVDEGTTYAIELTPPLQEEWIERCSFFAPIPFICTEKSKAKMPQAIFSVDYAAEKARNEEYRKLQQTLGKTMKADTGGESEASIALKEAKPNPDWPVLAKINQMSAINAYNDAVANWYTNREQFSELLKLLLKIHATTPNSVKEGMADWKARLRKSEQKEGTTSTAKSIRSDGIFTGKSNFSLLQVWNPSSGKGQNTAKANRLVMDNVDSFWLCEYLKMVGFYHCAIPRFVLMRQAGGKPPKDRKTFALAPVNITLSAHLAIFEIFREALKSNSAVKLDILAALRYTDCFLQYCEAAQSDDLAAQLWGNSPENFVAGLHTAFYKDLGNSSAVMNLSFINLPHWMKVGDANGVRTYRAIIAEHTSVIGSLKQDENPASEGGEELALLSRYRDFLSANDVTAFFDFTAGYGGYLMNALERERFWIKPLQQTNLEVLLMNSEPKLKPIIENEGFQRIAEAIRRSTITPQYLGKNSLYDVRYGLGQELKRRANYPHEFIIALSDFLQSYNAENARVFEVKKQQMRKNVQTEDISEIVRLIDEHGAPVVAHLLLAFGYASASKDEGAPATNDSTQLTSGGNVL